jgi:hypothetical protein
MRACCDPCTDPNAVTLRDGTRVAHFTNFPRGGTWGPIEFGFYEALDEDDPESLPNLAAPIDLTGSTWELNIYSEDPDNPGGLLTFGSFDDFDTSDHATGLVRATLTDTELTGDAVVGADCAPTYVYELIQTRDSLTAYPYIGTIQVTDVTSLLDLLGS